MIKFRRLPSSNSLQQNVRLIAYARVVLFVFAELFLLLNYLFLDLEFNGLLAQGILSLFAISAVLTFIQTRTPQLITERVVRLQLVSDVVIMSLLFHYTGGAANPFVSILLFPLIVSASILPGKFTWFMVVLTLSCYGSLFLPSLSSFLSPSLPELKVGSISTGHALHQQAATSQSAFSLHIIGMWFNFAISAVLISFFVVKMRQEIDQQQSKINSQREQALRDEQLLGIATQAASAAHHMSTPLSTMAVIINDLQYDLEREQREYKGGKDDSFKPQQFREDIDVLAAQVDNCKQVLDGLRHRAEFIKQSEAVSDFMKQLVDEFRLLRPGACLEEHLSEELVSAGNNKITSDPALRMAILNVLNNAADASPSKILLKASSTKTHLVIEVIDYGAGFDFPPEHYAGAELGPLESSKADGMGLGLFLSHATINRYKGEISISSKPGEGSHTRVLLLLDKQLLDEQQLDPQFFGSQFLDAQDRQ